MAQAPLSLNSPSTNIYKSGTVVGVTDKVYDLQLGQSLFQEILVRGDLSGDLEYNGHKIRITKAETAVGLLVDDRGARGPVWQGVTCEVLT